MSKRKMATLIIKSETNRKYASRYIISRSKKKERIRTQHVTSLSIGMKTTALIKKSYLEEKKTTQHVGSSLVFVNLQIFDVQYITRMEKNTLKSIFMFLPRTTKGRIKRRQDDNGVDTQKEAVEGLCMIKRVTG